MRTKRVHIRPACLLVSAMLALSAGWVAPSVSAQTDVLSPASQASRPPFPPQPPVAPLPPARKVFLVKSADAPDNLGPNGTFDYKLLLHNNTAETARAVVSDTLPAETELVGSPVVIELTPSADPLTTTFDSTLGPRGTIRWEGTLTAGAKIQVIFKVRLLSCPEPDQSSFIGWDRSVKNVASLRVNDSASISVATHAFKPGGCRDNPPPPPRPEPGPVAGADVAVHKFARLHPDRNLPERGWQVSWLVHYGNRGDQTATGVQVIDTPSSNQTLTLVRTVPRITPTQEGGAFIFDVGDLPGLRGGSILLRTAVGFDVPAGTVLTNTARITATNDVSPTNNTAAVTLTLPHLPPIITYPVSGAT